MVSPPKKGSGDSHGSGDAQCRGAYLLGTPPRSMDAVAGKAVLHQGGGRRPWKLKRVTGGTNGSIGNQNSNFDV